VHQRSRPPRRRRPGGLVLQAPRPGEEPVPSLESTTIVSLTPELGPPDTPSGAPPEQVSAPGPPDRRRASARRPRTPAVPPAHARPHGAPAPPPAAPPRRPGGRRRGGAGRHSASCPALAGAPRNRFASREFHRGAGAAADPGRGLRTLRLERPDPRRVRSH